MYIVGGRILTMADREIPRRDPANLKRENLI